MPTASKLFIGVDLDDLRLPTKEAVRAAAHLQFEAVEVPAAAGDATPEGLSSSGRRHFQRFVDGFGLRLASLSADFPGLRLTDPQTAEQRIERTCLAIDLARDLRVPVVTASVGGLTHPESGEPSSVAIESLHRIGERADARGVRFATGHRTTTVDASPASCAPSVVSQFASAWTPRPS
jgi:sugar phosphate isomerase/epimerase